MRLKIEELSEICQLISFSQAVTIIPSHMLSVTGHGTTKLHMTIICLNGFLIKCTIAEKQQALSDLF